MVLSNPELLNFLNNGGFTLQLEAHNNFTRIDMNQVIEVKTNRKTQISSVTEGYSLESGAVICNSVTADYRGLYFFWMLGEMVMFYSTNNQNKYKYLWLAYVERDKKDRGPKLTVKKKCLFLLGSILFLMMIWLEYQQE